MYKSMVVLGMARDYATRESDRYIIFYEWSMYEI